MDLSEFREYCLSKPQVSEGFPFDSSTLVFKVAGKMFALTDIDAFESVNLKGEPEDNIQLREQYQGVIPGYHMNKKHWNTISFREDVPLEVLLKCVDQSYALVVKSLPKKLRDELSL